MGEGGAIFSSSRAKRLEQRIRQMDRASVVRFRAPDGSTVEFATGAAADAFIRLMANQPSGLPEAAMAIVAQLDPNYGTCDLEQVLILAARGDYPNPQAQ